MTRFDTLADRYTDSAGKPLNKGKIKFEISGGGTDLTTFSDINQTVGLENSNPVILSAAGVPPPIFFTGEAKAILLNSGDTQLKVLDPVPGGASALDAFSDYSASITYSIEDITRGSNDRYFKSITNNNINNDPVTSNGFWIEINFIHTWDTAYTFSIDFVAVASDSNLYISRVNSNVGNDPVSSPTEWRILTETGSVVGPGSSTDNAIARYDLATGLLLQDSGVLIDDSENVSGIGTLDIDGDFTIAEGKVAITNTANEAAFSLTSSATTLNSFTVLAQVLSTGQAGLFQTDNSSFSAAGGLLKALVNDGSASGNCIVAQQDGTGFSYVGRVTTTIKFQVDGPDGDVRNTNNSYGAISDRKTKTQITAIEPSSYTERFMKLRWSKYKRNDELTRESEGGLASEWRLGLIHDEVLEIFPGCTATDLDWDEIVTGKDKAGADITETIPRLDDSGVQTSTGAIKNSIVEGTIAAIVLQELVREFREYRIKTSKEIEDLTARL